MIKLNSSKLIDKLLIMLLMMSIAAYLVGYGIINFWGFPLFCDTDMYADTAVAKLMWEQKTLFPDGWLFGNQYYVVATPVLCALLYGIVGNVNIAMALATEIMTVLLILSLIYVLRPFTKDSQSYLVACLLLLSVAFAPSGVASTHAQLLFIMASYYACYLITMFLVLGDYIRTVHHSQQKRPGMWILCLVLCFATGMQSLRQTAIMVLPLLACEIFLSLRRLILKQKMWQKSSLSRVLTYCAANVLGLVTIHLLNPAHYVLYEASSPLTASVIRDRAIRAWTSFLRISGLQFVTDNDVSSFYGVFSVFLILLVLGATVLWLMKIHRQEDSLTLCWLVSVVSVLAVALSTILTSTAMRPIYLFTWFAVVIFSAIQVLTHLPPVPKRVVTALLCVLCLGSLYYSYRSDIMLAIRTHESDKPVNISKAHDVHPGTSFYDSQQLCQWALENGYEYVYGCWFTSPRIAVHSGGDLTAGYWLRGEPLCPIGYLNLQNIYGPEENAKAIYVTTEEEEPDLLFAAKEQGVSMTEVATFGMFTAYTSPIPLMEGQPFSYQ